MMINVSPGPVLGRVVAGTVVGFVARALAVPIVITCEQDVLLLIKLFTSVIIAVAVYAPSVAYVCACCKLTLLVPIPPPSVTSRVFPSPKLKVTLLTVAPGEFPLAVKFIDPPGVAVLESTDKLVQRGGWSVALVGVAVAASVVGVGVSISWVVGVGEPLNELEVATVRANGVVEESTFSLAWSA